MLKTIIFFLSPTGGITQIEQHQYARLVRGEAADPRYAGQTVRVADWYVKVGDGQRIEVENETYSLLNFDSAGHVFRPAGDQEAAQVFCPQGGEMETFKEQENMRGSNVEFPWYPSQKERRQMQENIA